MRFMTFPQADHAVWRGRDDSLVIGASPIAGTSFR